MLVVNVLKGKIACLAKRRCGQLIKLVISDDPQISSRLWDNQKKVDTDIVMYCRFAWEDQDCLCLALIHVEMLGRQAEMHA